MTERQIRIARALASVNVPFGASKRRSFIRSLEGIATTDPERALSAAQLRYMCGLCHVFRRQLSETALRLADEEYAVIPMAALALPEEKHAEASPIDARPRPARQLKLFA
jgi:hypothetical protein